MALYLLLLRLTGRNAHQDAMAVGWSGRPWLRAGGSFSVGYRYNDGPAWHPPHMAGTMRSRLAVNP